MNAATELADEIEDEGADLTFIIVADEERELIVKALRAYASAPQADLAGAVDSGTPSAAADLMALELESIADEELDDFPGSARIVRNAAKMLRARPGKVQCVLCDQQGSEPAPSDIDSEGR